MQGLFFQFVFLILVILALVMVANRFRIAYPIILVLGGLLLSFTSLFDNLTIDPEIVFLIFLPPLLYEAAWQTSWKEFWRWRRVITSFAFPIVIITSCVIALVSNVLIPGFTLALGFLIGGIISPPDAVSATTIMRQVKAPKSLVSIIEGESLLNDASSLVVFRFSLAAVLTGHFYFQEAALSFVAVIGMGLLIGLAVGAIFYCILRWLPTTTSIEIMLTLLAPYCMYYSAEYFHFSGVLAVVTGGLFLSSKRQDILTYRSRIQGVNVWTNFVFVLNGIIFLLIGLQMPSIISQLGNIGLGTAIGYGLAISLVLIITRMACTFGAAFFTKFMSRFITVADPNPDWKMPFIAGWAGMRGVVSLAAALSIPLLDANGAAFPYRSLILFITFIVILVTLVFQGITLAFIIRKIKPEDKFNTIPENRQEIIIRKKLASESLKYLDEKFGEKITNDPLLHNMFSRYQIENKIFGDAIEGNTSGDVGLTENFQEIYFKLLEHQRNLLSKMNLKMEFDEDIIRKYLALIDLEEYKLRERNLQL